MNSCGDPARNDPVDEHDERNDEQRRHDDTGDHDVQGIELGGVALEVARLAHAEERPADGAQGARERALALRRGVLRVGGDGPAHERAPAGLGASERADCAGSAGTLPPTSKKVYDKVIVFTSLGNFESITKTTGHCLDSPAFSTCSVKQKHSSLLKCAIATLGA